MFLLRNAILHYWENFEMQFKMKNTFYTFWKMILDAFDQIYYI